MAIERGGKDLAVRAALPDNAECMPVSFEEIRPGLFRESWGIIATGRLGSDGTFVVEETLAEHDENYRFPEALERAGQMLGTSAVFATTAVVDP